MSGADLVREAGGGIVAVELEYRLGIFGEYYSCPELQDGLKPTFHFKVSYLARR